MDIVVPIVICVVLFILFSICGYCCRRRRNGTVIHTQSAVGSSTSFHQHSVPYPTTPLHPTPQLAPMTAPAPGFVPVGSYQSAPYPPAPGLAPGGAPYPPTNTPYPPTNTTYPPMNTPYPPAPCPTSQAAPPPSYNEAVGEAPVQPPPVHEQYTKQAPYNPNY